MSPYITSTDEDELRKELKDINSNLELLRGTVSEGQIRAWKLRKDIVNRRLRKLKHDGKLLSTKTR